MPEHDPSPPDSAQLLREVGALAAHYRLVLTARRYRGRIGQRRGTGPGSSLELHDFRDYTPGDDLRHVDWRGYARTDQLRVRLHEAEVAPIVEVLLDTSASMAITAVKEHALRGLALLFGRWASQEGTAVRSLALGGDIVDPALVKLTASLPAVDAPELPRAALRPGSVRVLITDALWPADPGPLLRRLANDAARFVCLQLLDDSEREPVAQGAVTLLDCESAARASLRLDAHALGIYKERLARHCAAVRQAVLGQGGNHVMVAAASLATMCDRDLLAAGVVEPA